MAKKQLPQNAPQNGPVVNNINVAKLQRASFDIADFKAAIDSAENKYAPQRKRLYEIYNQANLDGHLRAVVGKRILNITNKTPRATTPDGQAVLGDVLASAWFSILMQYIIESRFWGHSLIEGVVRNGELVDVALLPRQNVSPEQGLVLFESANPTSGLPFRVPPYDALLLEAGRKDDLGIYLSTTAMVLYKRNNWGDWATFTELFGSPLRIYKYNPSDPSSREETIKSAQQMGSAAYIVLPEGVDVDFKEGGGGTGHTSYDTLRNALNAEISIAVLGQTMTTTDGASLSQSQVHQSEQYEVLADDERFVEGVLNTKLPAFLRAYGVAVPEGVVFSLSEEKAMPLAERLAIDAKLAALIPLSKKYLYQRYNLPMPENAADAVEGKKPLPGF